VLVEVKATGICHTDWFTLSGDDPEGLFPAILGHEGAGVVVDVGAGRDDAGPGRPRHPALHARVPAVQVLPVEEDQPLPEDPRDPGQGPHARRHEPLLARRQAAASLHGHVDVLELHRRPEIALAKIRPDAPFDIVCYIGCGVTTGVGAVLFTAKVEAGANVVVFGLGGIGLNVIQGAEARRREPDHRRRRQPGARGDGAEVRHDRLRQPKDVANVVDEIVRLTDGGADYSFECIGNTQTMRQALECCHKGWGQSIIIGVAPPAPRSRRGRSSSSPAGSGRARRSAARAAAATCRGSSTGTWTARSRSTSSSRHRLTLDDINRGFELMKRGESIRSVVVY
jgi:S-(hydroxymethyl)glutathione dehydrogenase/alcohol dehydrogenase